MAFTGLLGTPLSLPGYLIPGYIPLLAAPPSTYAIAGPTAVRTIFGPTTA